MADTAARAFEGFQPLRGLVAATFTPMRPDGSLDLGRIAPMVDWLAGRGVAAMYVLGSTGEGPSLTQAERRGAAEAFVAAAAGRMRVIVQVGSESLRAARELAEQSQEIGADAVSAVSPVYFKPDSAATLVESMREVAAGAPALPFYYYHIPAVTGVAAGALDFLKLAADRIPSLRGVKFTSQNVFEFQGCLEWAGDRFEVLWGLDEMLACGLAAGARGAVGSTYNFAAPIYLRMLEAFEAGDWDAVRREQSRSQALVRAFIPYGPRAAQKAIMAMAGFDCGPPRLPVPPLTPGRFEGLRAELEAIGFFDWVQGDAPE